MGAETEFRQALKAFCLKRGLDPDKIILDKAYYQENRKKVQSGVGEEELPIFACILACHPREESTEGGG